MSTIKVNAISDSAGANGNAITLATDGTCTAKITNNLSNRRLNYNGAMTVAQRGTSVSIGNTDGEYFSPDRWKFNRSNSGDYTISQDAESPAGFANSLKVACTGTTTVNGTNRETGIYYCFEGQDLQHLEKGTSSSKKLVLSWWFKTNKTGTYTVELMDTDNSFRHVGKEITVSDTNWNKYTWSIPADTTGVLDDDANKSIQMGLWLMSSGQYRGGTMQTAWGALAQANRAPNQVNFADSTSNVCYFSGIQLEVDNGSGIPTDFEHRSYGDELARCQRYYYKWVAGVSGYKFAARYNATGNGQDIPSMYWFPTSMRANPTGALVGTWAQSNCSGISISATTPEGAYIRSETSGSGSTTFYPDGASNGFTMSAEL